MKKNIYLLITLLLLICILLTIFIGCKPASSGDTPEDPTVANVYKVVNGEKQAVTESEYNSIKDELKDFPVVDNDLKNESYVKDQLIGSWKYRSTIIRIYADQIRYVYNKYSKAYKKSDNPNYVSYKPAPEITLNVYQGMTTPEGNHTFPMIYDGSNYFVLTYKNTEYSVKGSTMYLQEFYLMPKDCKLEKNEAFLLNHFPRVSTNPDFEDYDKSYYDPND